MGLLTTAILVVNNLRDIETDRAAGKRTLAVRLGRRGTQNEYLLLLGGAYLAPLLTAVFRVVSPWVLLSWLSIPPALLLIRLILNEKGRPLNKALAGTGQLELAYGALYSLGLLVAAL